MGGSFVEYQSISMTNKNIYYRLTVLFHSLGSTFMIGINEDSESFCPGNYCILSDIYIR